LSVGYYFLVPVGNVELKDEQTKWFSINKLPKLGFDHRDIINRALEDLSEKVMTEPVIFELLEDKFTLNELQLAFEAVLGIEIDNRNFRKKALSKSYIVSLDEKRVGGGSKKPANLFMFSRDIYNKTSNKNQIIII
jgi:8-oxo-dGTP diphosphatase